MVHSNEESFDSPLVAMYIEIQILMLRYRLREWAGEDGGLEDKLLEFLDHVYFSATDSEIVSINLRMKELIHASGVSRLTEPRLSHSETENTEEHTTWQPCSKEPSR